MPFTRAKAEALLNRTEMGLYDDSRINSLRKLSASQISQRIERGRRARDRARDLVKRQKLASRERTGAKRGTSGLANERSKQKAELMADILKRFDTALAPARKRERDAGASTTTAARKRATASGASPAGATTSKRASGARTTPTPVAAAADRAGTKATPAAAARAAKAAKPARTAKVAKPPASKPAGRPAAKAPRRASTPKRALASTRKLLAAKQASDREAKPWQTLDPDRLHVPEPGYQSTAAARNALALHAAESRMAPIHGSISTRDRRNQGKRDHRGDND